MEKAISYRATSVSASPRRNALLSPCWYDSSVLRVTPCLACAILTGLLLPLAACLDPCGSTILEEALSPGGRQRAVVFQRDCGATTDFGTHISVLDIKETLPRSGGNAFDAGNMKVTAHWESVDHLVVSYPNRALVFRKEAKVKGVRISYEEKLLDDGTSRR
jgi:hypothetical protein